MKVKIVPSSIVVPSEFEVLTEVVTVAVPLTLCSCSMSQYTMESFIFSVYLQCVFLVMQWTSIQVIGKGLDRAPEADVCSEIYQDACLTPGIAAVDFLPSFFFDSEKNEKIRIPIRRSTARCMQIFIPGHHVKLYACHQ